MELNHPNQASLPGMDIAAKIVEQKVAQAAVPQHLTPPGQSAAAAPSSGDPR